MENIAEQRLLEQHVIGGSLVYVGYHLLGFVPLFGGFSLFELNGLLLHLIYFPFFIAISFVSYLLTQKRFPEWPLVWHAGLLFIMANILLGRIPLNDSVLLAEFPYANDFFYWLRWSLAFSCLVFVNGLVRQLSVFGKWLVAGLPLLFVVSIFGLLITGS